MELTLSAGEKQFVPIEGYGWYFIAGDGPIELELREHDGRVDQAMILQPGQGPQGSMRFEGFTVKNLHTAAQTIVFYIGERRFVDNRQVGIVSVVNADKSRSENGAAFQMGAAASAQSGEFSLVYLENPVGSGVDVIVNMAVVSQAAGTSGQAGLVMVEDIAAMEADGNYTFRSENTGNASKLVGPAVAVNYAGKVKTASFPSQPASFRGSGKVYIAAPGVHEYRFTEPYVIKPGAAIGVRSYTANELVQGTFEWFEEVGA